MNRRYLPILSILAVGLIATGCGTTTPATDRSFTPAVESISADIPAVKLEVNKSIKVETIIYPGKAYNVPLTFTSSNTSVATVNSNGVIKGIKNGTATITITPKDDSLASKTIVVYVVTNKGNSTEVDAAVAAQYATQVASFPLGLEAVRSHEVRQERTIVDGKILNSSYQDNAITISNNTADDGRAKEAYIDIEEIDRDTKITDGGITVTPYRWTFITDDDYNTFLYHENGDGAKTRLKVPSQSYLTKGRLAALTRVLNTVFTNGGNLYQQTYDNALSATMLSQFELVKSDKTINYLGGCVSESGVSFAYNYSRKIVAGYDEERYNSIPYGVNVTEEYYQDIYWEDGIARALDISLNYNYSYNGKSYRKEITMKYYNEVNYFNLNSNYVQEFELFHPVDAEYRVAKDISEL